MWGPPPPPAPPGGGGGGGPTAGYQAAGGQPDFEAWYDTLALTPETRQTLMLNGCASVTVMSVLQGGDLESMKLGIGQLRVIQAAVKLGPFLGKATPLSGGPTSGGQVASVAAVVPYSCFSQAVAVDDVGMALGTVVNPAAAGTGRLLGIGPKGESIEYLKIKNYVTVRNDDESAKVMLPDGSYFVPKYAFSQKIKLDSVSPLQFMEANSGILAVLISKGMSLQEVQQYLPYSVLVARLEQKLQWHSLLHFDNEYRQAQAAEGFSWGTDAQHVKRPEPQTLGSEGCP